MNPTDKDFYMAMGVDPAEDFVASVYTLARAMADRDDSQMYDADAAMTDPVVKLARELAGLKLYQA